MYVKYLAPLLNSYTHPLYIGKCKFGAPLSLSTALSKSDALYALG